MSTHYLCKHNCGGTGCYAKTTVSSKPICKHKNGWYVTVRFFIWEKRIYVCSDCGESIEQKRK